MYVILIEYRTCGGREDLHELNEETLIFHLYLSQKFRWKYIQNYVLPTSRLDARRQHIVVLEHLKGHIAGCMAMTFSMKRKNESLMSCNLQAVSLARQTGMMEPYCVDAADGQSDVVFSVRTVISIEIISFFLCRLIHSRISIKLQNMCQIYSMIRSCWDWLMSTQNVKMLHLYHFHAV